MKRTLLFLTIGSSWAITLAAIAVPRKAMAVQNVDPECGEGYHYVCIYSNSQFWPYPTCDDTNYSLLYDCDVAFGTGGWAADCPNLYFGNEILSGCEDDPSEEDCGYSIDYGVESAAQLLTCYMYSH